MLITASLVMFLQIRYILKKSLGYDREHVVVTRMTDPGIRRNFAAFKNRVLQSPNIIGVTTSDSLPTQVGNTWGGGKFSTDGGAEVRLSTKLLWTDYDFLDFYRMEIVNGRRFAEHYGTDQTSSVIINEKFARDLNWANPAGKIIRIYNDEERTVVGVVKDFHFQSMHSEILPILIFCRPENHYIQIRMRAHAIPETIAYVRKTFEAFREGHPFDYSFLDENFTQMYDSERKSGQILASLSGLAIFLACLGIFGLASFTAERRTKEIGIRRVLGASAPRIICLLSGEFAKWIAYANLIAWPIAYYVMSKWLRSFAYRTDLRIEIFFFSGLVALCIALLTVSFHTVKAATAKPVDSLRYE
jgi:putative ABC transport system permease protein